MQIFFSHSSKQKPLVREIKSGLPDHLNFWLDEQKLLFGDSIPQSIESTIKIDTDYVLLFIDEFAVASEWVQRELRWTLEAEKQHSRTILLPVVIDETAVPKIVDVDIQNRKYLRLRDYLEASIRALSNEIASELFALVCRDMHRLGSPKPKSPLATITDAEALLSAYAAMIQKAVFPHRSANPISTENLLEVLNSIGDATIPPDQFRTILSVVTQRNMIPGFVYDGFEAYVLEEHARWKAEVYQDNKQKIGRKTAGLIQSGMKVFIDAGSTAEETVRVLCTKIENRAVSRLTVATTSVNIADMISDCCVKMGFDDDFSALRLFVPGGQVRPGTQAIIPAYATDRSQIAMLSETVGGFDLGILGVNGIDPEEGFTTHGNPECTNKRDIIVHSKRRIIVGDSSKTGIVLEEKFADFKDDILLVIDNDASNDILQEIAKLYSQKVLLV